MASAAVHSGFWDFSSLFSPIVDRKFLPSQFDASKLGVDDKAVKCQIKKSGSIISVDRSISSSSSTSSVSMGSASPVCSRSSSSSSSHTSCSGHEKCGKQVYAPLASEMIRVFERLDENHDGLICAEDLRRFVRRLGYEISIEEAKGIVGSVDRNNDGKIDFEEFYSLYKSLSDDAGAKMGSGEHDDEEDTLLSAFRVFDKNQDGFITAIELQTVLNDLGISEGQSLKSCQKMIQRVDSDGNGEIDISEFKAMMCCDCFVEI